MYTNAGAACGAVSWQVLVATREVCWSLPLYAQLVVIMDTQIYDGKLHRYGKMTCLLR